MELTHINTNIVGNIINVNCGIHQFTRDEFFSLCKNNTIKLNNAVVTEKNTIKMNWYNYGQLKITSDYEVIPYTNIKINQVTFQRLAYRFGQEQLKLIKNIVIESDFEFVVDIFVKLGAKKITNSTFKLDFLQLVPVMQHYKWYRNVFSKLGIRCYGDTIIFYDDELNEMNKGNVILIEDDTDRQRLLDWLKKAAVLGVSDDYHIDIDSMTLCRYNGNTHKVILPPVYSIGYRCFTENNNISELNIPDSVRVIDRNNLSKLKNIKLGKNTTKIINLDDSLITELDTRNLYCDISLHGVKRLKMHLKMADKKIKSFLGAGEIELIDR